MSRLGKKPIQIPKGVEVSSKDNILKAKGPKGMAEQKLISGIDVQIKDSKALVNIDEKKISKAFHGLYRSLVKNIITGVEKGFAKRLSLLGVGFRAAVKGNKIELQVGYSKPAALEIPQDIQVKVEKSVEIIVSGLDKQLVGQFAAKIRAIKPINRIQMAEA